MPFEELKEKQSVMWGSGSYEPIVDITSEIHDTLVERLPAGPGDRWLDVATGTGAVALLAARRGASVTGLDLAPALIETAKRKAYNAQLDVAFDVGDAESLPYADGSFDVVSSACGVMFAPDHEAAASELARVCRKGGRLALAAWTPDSGVGQMFGVLGRFNPPPVPGVGDPFAWGTEARARELLEGAFELELEVLDAPLRGDSGEDLWQRFVTAFGPTKTLAASLEPDRREELHQAYVECFEGYRTQDGIVQSRTYLLVLGRRR